MSQYYLEFRRKLDTKEFIRKPKTRRTPRLVVTDVDEWAGEGV